MRRIAFLLVLVSLSLPAEAQWKQIANFEGWDGVDSIGECITCVYFLDLPGPPRIGFAGTGCELWKTLNGGATWSKIWGDGSAGDNYYVSDICFKDSMTGWFCMSSSNECYRTTDGGIHWTNLIEHDSEFSPEALYYCSGTNKLFLSLAGGIVVSTDLGDSWKLVVSYGSTGVSFSNDSIGIASAYPTDSTSGIIRTTDGGLNWSVVDTVAIGSQLLAIPGTPICFEADRGRIIIRRSDDYGKTWRVINELDSTLFGTGVIRGDTTRLYIKTVNSMYVSTDQGITWSNDHGPGSDGDVTFSIDKFYSAKGVTVAGRNYGTILATSGGLWEETWPTSGVAEQVDSASSFRVFPNPAGSSITVERASGSVAVYDPLGRSCTTPQPPPWKGGGVVLDVSGLPSGMYFVSDGVQRTKFIKE